MLAWQLLGLCMSAFLMYLFRYFVSACLIFYKRSISKEEQIIYIVFPHGQIISNIQQKLIEFTFTQLKPIVNSMEVFCDTTLCNVADVSEELSEKGVQCLQLSTIGIQVYSDLTEKLCAPILLNSTIQRTLRLPEWSVTLKKPLMELVL